MCPKAAQEEKADSEKENDTISDIQAMINSLPEPSDITLENSADVEALLEAIDAAKLPLTDEEREELNFTRYQDVINALDKLNGMEGASIPQTLSDITIKNEDIESGVLTLSDGNTYTLGENITVTKTIVITGDVTLDLNGYDISMGSSASPVIMVGDGDTETEFILRDTEGGSGIFATENTVQYTAGGIAVRNKATLYMYGGAISDCGTTAGDSAGSVCVVTGGTFNMLDNGDESGVISGCTTSASNGAGGVYVTGEGKFSMKGGTITLCDSTNEDSTYSAGGVVVKDSSQNCGFFMTGGTVSHCTNKGQMSAGGVCVANLGKFSMDGGTVSDCYTDATSSAGGVYVYKGTFALSEGSTVTKCDTSASNTAGGVYVGASGVFKMDGGTVSDCDVIVPDSAVTTVVSNSAGGVYVDADSSFDLDSGKIWNCTFGFRGILDNTGYERGTVTGVGGVYNKGSFNMDGGNVQYCSAYNSDEKKIMSTFRSVVGGVYNGETGTLTMTGGNVQNCFFYFHSQADTDRVVDYSLVNCGTMYAGGGTVCGAKNTGNIKADAKGGVTECVLSLSNAYNSIGFVNDTGAVVSAGTFNAEVSNNATISGGTFNGKVNNLFTDEKRDTREDFRRYI